MQRQHGRWQREKIRWQRPIRWRPRPAVLREKPRVRAVGQPQLQVARAAAHTSIGARRALGHLALIDDPKSLKRSSAGKLANAERDERAITSSTVLTIAPSTEALTCCDS